MNAIPPLAPYESPIYFCIFCDSRSRLLHASTRLSVFFLRIVPAYSSSSMRATSHSRFFCMYHVLFLTAEVPPSRSPSAHRIYSDFLTCSTLSILSHRQFHRVPSSISIAHVLRLCSFTIPSFPPPFLCNDAFISPYPHRYYVARVFVPANRARRLFLFRTIRPDASRPPVSMPRTEVALLSVPLHSSLFVKTLVARRITLLHVSVPLSRMSRCQSASLTTSLWLSRISLRIFALDIG